MIPHDLEQRILRLHFVEHWPVGTIAKQCGVHHSTVKRVLHDHGVQQPLNTRSSLIDPFLGFIEQTLQQHPRLPASRLHQMVAQRGYPGSESHFRRLIARLRPRKPAEAYARLRTLPAEEAQVDWAHFGQHTIGRAKRPLSAFVLVLSYSRMPFVQFFFDQRMTSFLTGHVHAFAFLGGAPRRVLYDNLKSVVIRRQGDIIDLNQVASAFAGHYGYEIRPVAIARGNEKGRVERTIRYLRTSFWPACTWTDLDDLNRQVLHWCRDVASARKLPEDDTLTVHQAWQDERADLRRLPDDDFPVADIVFARVGKQPYVRFDKNDYSIPHNHVRRTVAVHACPTTVRIFDGDTLIAEHARCFDRRQTIETPEHIAALVAQKKQARKARGQHRVYTAVPSSEALLREAVKRGHSLGSAIAALLRLLDTWGADAVESAVQHAIASDAFHVAAVRQILDQRAQDAQTPPPMPLHLPSDPRIDGLHVTPHSLATYDNDNDNMSMEALDDVF